jgi:hypothetical protein
MDPFAEARLDWNSAPVSEAENAALLLEFFRVRGHDKLLRECERLGERPSVQELFRAAKLTAWCLDQPELPPELRSACGAFLVLLARAHLRPNEFWQHARRLARFYFARSGHQAVARTVLDWGARLDFSLCRFVFMSAYARAREACGQQACDVAADALRRGVHAAAMRAAARAADKQLVREIEQCAAYDREQTPRSARAKKPKAGS